MTLTADIDKGKAARPPPEGVALSPLDTIALGIDWHRVAAYLADHGLRLDEGFAPRRFAGGLANINLLIRLDHDWAVLRRPPTGPLPKGAHDMAREHKVLSRLHQQLPLAPQSLLYCPDPLVCGAPFQILSFHDGRSIRGSSLAPLPETAATGAALSAMLVDTLVSIHRVDTVAAGLSDLGRPEGFLSRNAAGWIGRANAVTGSRLSAPAAELAAWLMAREPAEPTQPTLLHNDFKLDNIIVARDRIAPVAIVDWDMATRGDPLFDLATLLSYWTEQGDPDAMHVLGQMPTARPGFMSREQAAHRYAEATGRGLNGLLFPRVLAIFKLGVVFLQLAALNGSLAGRGAAASSVEPDGLFAFGLDVANGHRF